MAKQQAVVFMGSNFEDISFLRVEAFVDFLHPQIGKFLDLALVTPEVIFAQRSSFLRFLQLIKRVAPGGAHPNPGFLCHLFDPFHQLSPAFLGQ